MKKILFVCTGNTCRSSMAEGLFKQLLIDKQRQGGALEGVSAGTLVLHPEPANPKAIKVMEDMGIDIESHKSQPLTYELAHGADLILTMTQRHKDHILQMEPGLQEKVFTLLEYIDEGDKSGLALDIPDPFGLSIAEYKQTAHVIYQALEKVLDKINRQ